VICDPFLPLSGIIPSMKSSLTCIGFHSVLNNSEELKSELLFPFQPVTVKNLKETIEPLLEKGYEFIKPSDISEGLDNNKNYALLIFDDGYFNNTNALNVLKEFNIPAVFFVAMDPVKTGNAFWWDVVFRRRNKQGVALKNIRKEISSVEILNNPDKEQYLFENFGKKSFKPVSDLDRSFSKSELESFFRDDNVVIGNHSLDHTPLTSLAQKEVENQIKQAQEELGEITIRKNKGLC